MARVGRVEEGGGGGRKGPRVVGCGVARARCLPEDVARASVNNTKQSRGCQRTRAERARSSCEQALPTHRNTSTAAQTKTAGHQSGRAHAARRTTQAKERSMYGVAQRRFSFGRKQHDGHTATP